MGRRGEGGEGRTAGGRVGPRMLAQDSIPNLLCSYIPRYKNNSVLRRILPLFSLGYGSSDQFQLNLRPVLDALSSSIFIADTNSTR